MLGDIVGTSVKVVPVLPVAGKELLRQGLDMPAQLYRISPCRRGVIMAAGWLGDKEPDQEYRDGDGAQNPDCRLDDSCFHGFQF